MPVSKQYNVLLCPLDWGIGHATRSVPIINELINQGCNVIIGADHQPLAFLKIEFPKLKFVPFPGTKISYPNNKMMALKMLLSAPSILLGIYKEHRLLKKIIQEHDIDFVISDNRYGLWHSKIPSVFITHQIGIETPKSLRFLKPLLRMFTKFFIHKYNELWIPDLKNDKNLSGSLSHGYRIKIPHFFIGPLSRFQAPENDIKIEPQSILAIVSGPEPQRTIFENILIMELQKHPVRSTILRGKPELKQKEQRDNITLYSHLPTPEFLELIAKAEYIICRSGYCTLMDLAILHKKAVIVPTPGQTEQEYLAKYLHQEGIFLSQKQSSFSLENVLNEFHSYSGIKLEVDQKMLTERIAALTSI